MKYIKKFNEGLDGNSEIEEWENVPSHIGDGYEVSSFGRFKNSQGKIVKPFIHKKNKNSLVIRFSNNNKNKSFTASRIIAEVFIGKDDRPVIHLDGNKSNNKVSNLKYTNSPSKYSAKFSKKASGENAHDSYKIKQYNLKGDYVETYGSIGEAGRKFNIPTTNISKVAKGKRNSAGGYIWIYDESVDPQYRGTDPDKIKEVRDFYSMNKISFGDLHKKFNITEDSYGISRIIRSLVYRSDKYLSDRSKEIISSLLEQGKNSDEIKDIMKTEFKYYITDEMISDII